MEKNKKEFLDNFECDIKVLKKQEKIEKSRRKNLNKDISNDPSIIGPDSRKKNKCKM